MEEIPKLTKENVCFSRFKVEKRMENIVATNPSYWNERKLAWNKQKKERREKTRLGKKERTSTTRLMNVMSNEGIAR